MIKYTILEKIDWASSFSLLEIVIQMECFLCFIWILKVSRPYEVDTDTEERFASFKVTTSNESSVCASSLGSIREQLVLFWRTTELYAKWKWGKWKQNNGLRIYGEGRTQIPLSSPVTIGPLPKIHDRQVLY